MTRILLALAVLACAACAPATPATITAIDPTAIDTLWIAYDWDADDYARLTEEPGGSGGCPVPWGSPVQIREKWSTFARVRTPDCEGWILMSKLEVR